MQDDQEFVDKNLFYQIVNAVVRHLITAASASLVANGYLTDSNVQMIVGSVVTLITIAGSIINKKYLVKTNFVPSQTVKVEN